MAYSRNEYLQSLNRMRANYQNQGNPLINRENDDGNVGEELSSFAYMKTDIPAPEQASTGKDDGYHFGDVTRSITNAGYKGAWNFFDAIGDFVMTIGGAITGTVGGVISAIGGDGFEKGWEEGSNWAKEAITYDWQSQAQNFTDLTVNWLFNTINADEYGAGWEALGSAEASKARLDNIAKRGGTSEITPYVELAGEILPAVAVTIATFGASSAGSISRLQAGLINAGIAGASSTGSSMEKAVKESGKFGGAELGYSGLKGGISSLVSFGTSALGGQIGQTEGVVSKASTKLATHFSQPVARAIVKDTSDILIRTGIRVTEAGAEALLDPVLQSITYDEEALSKYGDEQYWDEFGKTLTTTAIIATLSSIAVKGGEIAKEGGWRNHINNLDYKILSQGAVEYDNLRQQMYKELEASKSPYEAKQIMEKYRGKMDALSNKLSKVMQTANEKYSMTTGKGENFVTKTRYTSGELKEMLNEKSINLEMYKTAKVLSQTKFKSQFDQMTKFSNGEMRFSGGSAGDFVDVDSNGNVSYGMNVKGKLLSVPASVGKDGKINIQISNRGDVLKAIQLANSSSPNVLNNEIQLKSTNLNIPEIQDKSINTELPYKLTKAVSSKILNKSNSKEIKNFLETGLKSRGKDNYVMKVGDGSKFVVVEPYKDGEVVKYGLITVDSKTNEILDINVKSENPHLDRAYVVPKYDEKKLLSTKLENEDGTAIVYDVKNVDFDWDITDEGRDFSINAKPADRAINQGGFIYSKNPLKVANFKKEISFARVSKVFNIPASLEKTYNLKLNNKTNELSALKWVAKRSNLKVQEVIEKLGYDSIVKSDKSVTFFNASNILERGVQFKYGKRSENYSDIVRRNVSENTSKELEKYIGGNGKELVTQEEGFKYSKLIRETLSYSLKKLAFDGKDYDAKIVSEDKYTPDMKRIAQSGKKIGVKTRFALSLQEYGDDDQIGQVSAYWSTSGNEIVIFVDSGRRGTLEQTAQHELGHAILDKLHGWTLLDMNSRVEYLEKKYPREVLKIRSQYVEKWKNYDPAKMGVEYNDAIYEEMMVDMYAGLLKIEDGEFQNALVKDMTALYEKGSKYANKEFYKLLAKEEASDYFEEKYETKPVKKASIGLAITYDKPITNETYTKLISKYKPIVEKRAVSLAKALGLKIKVGEAIGGWTFTDNAKQIQIGGEPSFPLTVENYNSIEDVKLFASILADTAHEVQNSVGVVEYDTNGEDVEDTFNLLKIDNGLEDIIKKAKLEGYTLYKTDKKLVVIGANDDTIELLLDELDNGGYLNGKEEHHAEHCKANWLGLKERADLYETRLKGGLGHEKGLLGSYVTKANEINKYMLEHLDSEGHRIAGTENNSSKIYNLLSGKVISDVKANSSTTLIEAGADVSKATKYRIDSVKEAFDTVLNEITPKNGEFKIAFGDVKRSFAELNLARPKDRAIVIDNLMKRIKNADVTLVTTLGEEKYKLGDLMTLEQENQAKDIMLSTLNGKAEATKLSKWANALNIQKIKTHETARSFKLLNRIQRKIKSGTVNYFSSPTDAPGELTLYDKIIHDVKLPFTNESLTNLTSNIALYYTENNFGKMLASFDIPFNSYIPELNEYLNSTIVKGKPLTARQISMGNDLLQFIYNDLKDLGKGVVAQNRAKARAGVVLAQALTTNPKDGFITKGINAIKTIDHSIRSPISVTTTIFGENHPFVIHLRDNGKSCENAQRDIYNQFRDQVFKNTEIKNIDKAGAVKVNFLGKKITTAQALHIINTSITAGEDFYKRGGSWTVGGRRVDFKPTEEDIKALQNLISPEMKKWNEENVLKFFNNESRTYVQKKFKTMNNVELPIVEGQYYPTSAVGDKIADIKISHSGSISPSDWGLSFLKERVSHTDAPYNLDGDVFKTTLGYIQKITQWGEWAEWYHDLKIMENSRVFGQGTSLNAVMEKTVTGWKDMMDFVHHTALGIPYDNSQNLMGKIDNAIGGVFQNFQQVAMMDLFTQIKTLGSDFTGWQFFGTKNVLKGLTNYWRHGAVFADKRASKIIDAYSPTLKNRHHTSEAFSANIGKVAKSKVAKVITSVVRTLDWHIHCKAFYMAQVQAKQEGYGEFWTDTNSERAVRILERYSDTTQPTTSKFNVGMYRAGANGKIVKQLFGMFQSMGQAIYQGMVGVTTGWKSGVRRIKAYEQASLEQAQKAEEYRVLEQEAKERLDNAQTDEEFAQARKDWEEAKFHREGHEKSKETIDEQIKTEKPKFTKKAWFNKSSAYIFGLLGSGLVLTLIAKTKKKAYGKEEWSDWDATQFAKDTAYASFVNWIPYVGTIANAVKNNSDLTIFTVDNMNNIVSAFTSLYKAIKEGNGSHIAGATLEALTTLSSFFGIPAKSIWNLLNGVWYNVDHGSNIAFKNWLGMYSSAYLRTQYKDAYQKKEHEKAISNLEVWTYNYSIKTSPEVLEEIYRLNTLGETGVAPTAIPSSYTNDKGETVSFTKEQATAFRTEYAMADKAVASLLKVEDYKSLDSKTQSSLVKRIYSSYKESAQAKALGIAPNSKLAKLVYFTNGDVDLAKYLMSIQSLSALKDDEKSTRKEKVIAQINKLSGFTKTEKLLLAYLSGYKVSESSQDRLAKFLISKGFSKKEAYAFIGVDK